MARSSYTQAIKEALVKAVLEARADGQNWNEAFAAARKLGYAGSLSSLQKLVRATIHNETPSRTGSAVRKTVSKKAAKPAATASNAFDSTRMENLNVRKNSAAASPLTLEALAAKLPVLRDGMLFTRPISLFHGPFIEGRSGEIAAWSRILEPIEALCVANTHGEYPRGGDVLVDSTLNPPESFLTVILNSAQKQGDGYDGTHPLGSKLPVERRWDGTAYVQIRDIPPGAMVLFSNAAWTVSAEARLLSAQSL